MICVSECETVEPCVHIGCPEVSAVGGMQAVRGVVCLECLEQYTEHEEQQKLLRKARDGEFFCDEDLGNVSDNEDEKKRCPKCRKLTSQWYVGTDIPSGYLTGLPAPGADDGGSDAGGAAAAADTVAGGEEDAELIAAAAARAMPSPVASMNVSPTSSEELPTVLGRERHTRHDPPANVPDTVVINMMTSSDTDDNDSQSNNNVETCRSPTGGEAGTEDEAGDGATPPPPLVADEYSMPAADSGAAAMMSLEEGGGSGRGAGFEAAGDGPPAVADKRRAPTRYINTVVQSRWDQVVGDYFGVPFRVPIPINTTGAEIHRRIRAHLVALGVPGLETVAPAVVDAAIAAAVEVAAAAAAAALEAAASLQSEQAVGSSPNQQHMHTLAEDDAPPSYEELEMLETGHSGDIITIEDDGDVEDISAPLYRIQSTSSARSYYSSDESDVPDDDTPITLRNGLFGDGREGRCVEMAHLCFACADATFNLVWAGKLSREREGEVKSALDAITLDPSCEEELGEEQMLTLDACFQHFSSPEVG